MIVLIYGANGIQGFMGGDDEQVRSNMAEFDKNPDVTIRRCDETVLSNMGTIMDSRAPRFIQEFDALYPNVSDWR